MVGSIGNIGCFSFFGNKVITTGEGGMCITNSRELNERMCILRDHGMSKNKRYWHDAVGFNYRMTNLQAAIGVAQVERIDEILRVREDVENMYRKVLADIEIIEFQKNNLPGRKKITWLVSILLNNSNADFYINKLKEIGIDVRRFFYSLSKMDIYKEYVFSNKNSEEISEKGINLPTKTNIDKDTINKICSIFSIRED
jgi:perosamine synthetase